MPNTNTKRLSPVSGWRHRLHEIVFEDDTPEGKMFDVALIAAIVLSIGTVIAESVPAVQASWGAQLRAAEWAFTILFTVEYVLRLLSVRSPRAYATSFMGVVDVLSVLPSYLTLFIPGAQAFLILRILRLLRLFRIFKMTRYVHESRFLLEAFSASKPKITVFIFTVTTAVTVVGAAMYLIEGRVNEKFSDIPHGIYWAIVTVTTVGFGDIVPVTVPGKVLASLLMVLGYGMIAVPTGIVTAELTKGKKHAPVSVQACQDCGKQGHDTDAKFCKYCGGTVHSEHAG